MTKNVSISNKILDYNKALDALDGNIWPIAVALNNNQWERMIRCKEKIAIKSAPKRNLNYFEMLSILYDKKVMVGDAVYVSISLHQLLEYIKMEKISIEYLIMNDKIKYIEDLQEENFGTIIVTSEKEENKKIDVWDTTISSVLDYELSLDEKQSKLMLK